MTLQEGLVAGDQLARLDVLGDRDRVDCVDEAERRPVRQQGDEGVGVGKWHGVPVAQGRTGCVQPLFTETIADYSWVIDVTRE